MTSQTLIVRILEAYPTINTIRDGYIGNVERWGDDRSWRIWIDEFQVRGTWGMQPLTLCLSGPDGISEDECRRHIAHVGRVIACPHTVRRPAHAIRQ